MDASELSAEIAPELPGNGAADPPSVVVMDAEARRVKLNARHNDTGIEPLGDRVLVRRIAEREMQGNVAIPEAHREKPVEGTVLAIGPGRDLESGYVLPCRVAPGDRIVFGRFAGVDLPEEYGKDLLLCRNDEILAVRS